MGVTRIRCGVLVTAALVLAGCVPADESPRDAGGGDGGDASAGVSYARDVQPIFMVKCADCHTTLRLGKHNIGTTYADALLPAESLDYAECWNDPVTLTMPKKIGECALILIKNGKMPLNAGCSVEPPLEPAMCLSAEQKATVEAWVTAGMPP
jgi:hypothetical protein